MSTWFNYLRIAAITYCIGIALLIIIANHKRDTSLTITIPSYLCSILILIAVVITTIAHHFPQIYGYCICFESYLASVAFYILAVFIIKFTYLERIRQFNQNLAKKSKTVSFQIKILMLILLITLITSLYMMIFYTHGECSGKFKITCSNSVDIINLYVAIGSIAFDTVVFTGFYYKWYKILKEQEIPSNAINMFILQLLFTLLAMFSCAVDASLNLMYSSDAKSVDLLSMIFILDCVIVTTCNCLLSKYSKMAIANILNILFCCKRKRQTLETKLSNTINKGSPPGTKGKLENKPSESLKLPRLHGTKSSLRRNHSIIGKELNCIEEGCIEEGSKEANAFEIEEKVDFVVLYASDEQK